MAGRKKKEEQLLRSLRELTALPHNKKCLECQERGPTYADMTTHGFVCTSCSGYLRGLNPPHRVKSISMTTFSEEELSLLKDGGNELAHAVWMGRWNPRQDKEPSKKDEVAFKEFLISKYERKMWYRSPVEVKLEREGSKASETPPPEPKLLPPPSTKTQRSAGTASTFAVQPPSSASSTPTTPVTSTTSATPTVMAPLVATATAVSSGQKPDLLGGLDDPFSSKAPPPGAVAVFPPGGAPLFRTHSEVLQPGTSGSGGTQSTSATTSSASNVDKYAALASLDMTLKELRVKDEPTPQPSPPTVHHAMAASGQPGFGGGGGGNPFGAPQQPQQPATGQGQFNPFATPPSQPVTGGLRPVAPGYGGFQAQQFSQSQQQFAAGGRFGANPQMGQAQMQMHMANPQMGQMQMANPQMGGAQQWQQMPRPAGQQWGQAYNQGQWMQQHQLQQQQLHQQQLQQQQQQQQQQQHQAAMQQQWGVGGGHQQMFGSVQMGPGSVPGGMVPGSFPQQPQVVAMQPSQFGGFVSAGTAAGGGQGMPQHIPQAKPFATGSPAGGGGGFNWGTSVASSSQQSSLSSSSGAVQSGAGGNVGMGWSSGLSKQAPTSSGGWGTGSVTPASSSGNFTGWSTSLQSIPAGWGGGMAPQQPLPQPQPQPQPQAQTNWGAMGNQPLNPFTTSTQAHKNPFL